MTWEDAVRRHFAKLPTSLLEMVEKFSLQETPKNHNLEDAIQTIIQLGYNTKVKGNTVKVLVPDDQRPEVLQLMRDTFEPLGFDFDPLHGGKYGRIKKFAKEGNTIILIKPEGSTGRTSALGAEYEDLLAKKISDKYGQYGITVKTAGFSHGSDLIIQGSEDSMSIELKTSSGADFGQFRLVYSPKTDRWMPAPTAALKKNEALFTGLFEDFLEGYLNQMAKFPDLEDPRLKNITGFITGLNAHLQTSELKKKLASTWFNGKHALIVPVNPASISSYYRVKGDRFIQIGRRGVYAFDPNDAQKFGVSLFEEKITKATLRFRIKPAMSDNGHHSFTVAVKMIISPSNKDLNNDDDLDSIIEDLI